MAKAPRVPGATTTSTAQPLPETKVAPLPAETPNSVDVDPKKITGPVLTRQGWICPDDAKKAA